MRKLILILFFLLVTQNIWSALASSSQTVLYEDQAVAGVINVVTRKNAH